MPYLHDCEREGDAKEIYKHIPINKIEYPQRNKVLLVTSKLASLAWAVYLVVTVVPDNVRPLRAGFALNLHWNCSKAKT